jgi:hypothetical protein
MKQQSPCKTCSRFPCNLHAKCQAVYNYSKSLGNVTFRSVLMDEDYSLLPK